MLLKRYTPNLESYSIHARLVQQEITAKERPEKQGVKMASRAELVYKVDLTPVQARESSVK